MNATTPSTGARSGAASGDPRALPTTLEPRYYLDPGVFEREKERVFLRTWQLAGHSSQVARPGDFFTFRVQDQSLFVVHGADGELRAFYNVCQHRAHELLEGAGNARVIACPYHAWTYETDGRLRRARGSERVPGFDPGRVCLTAVRVERFCGFLFVNLDPNAATMTATYPGVEERLRDLVPGIDDLALAHRTEAELEANWKIAVENYNECYHCRVVHPTFAQGVVVPDSYHVVVDGLCLRHVARSQPPGRVVYRYAADRDERALEYASYFLWPATSIQVYPGRVVNTYRWQPRGVAATTVCREWFLPEGQATPEQMQLIELDERTTFHEDFSVIHAVQRGLRSRGFRPAPLVIDPAGGVDSDHSVRALHEHLLAALAE